MIIVIHCHGAESGLFPEWENRFTEKKPSFLSSIWGREEPPHPWPIMFYFATMPGNVAHRITDVKARNLILDIANPGGYNLYGATRLALTEADFLPCLAAGEPLAPSGMNMNVLVQLSNKLREGVDADICRYDRQTFRLFAPGKIENIPPLPDYSLAPYALTDWPLGEVSITNRINTSSIVCVNHVGDNEKLSDVIQRVWNLYKFVIWGPVAVVCLFCRSR